MADKTIVMCKEMVLALLVGRKKRTMRIIKPQPPCSLRQIEGTSLWTYTLCEDEWKPRYQVGDRLIVQEGYRIDVVTRKCKTGLYEVSGKYLADNQYFSGKLTRHESNLLSKRKFPHRPTPGRFMYKSLARIFRTVTKVTIQRPQDLTEEECKAEGVSPENADINGVGGAYRNSFFDLWNSLHKDDWQKNEWCFVYHWEDIEVK